MINKKRIILIALVSVVIIIISLTVFFMNPRRQTAKQEFLSKSLDYVLTKQEATSDINQFYSLLKSRHPAWLVENDELLDSVETRYKHEYDAIDSDITVLELWRALSRISNVLRDGHTGVTYAESNPLFIGSIEEVGEFGKPIAINTVPIEDILAEYKKLGSYEYDFYAEYQFYNNIIKENFLRFCGVDTEGGVSFLYDVYACKNTYDYEFLQMENVAGIDADKENKWVYYKIDTENNAAIFTLNSCVNNDEYKDTLDAFFGEVFDAQIDNVIVDLRKNGGGNSAVINEFLKYIDIDGYNSWKSNVRYGWYLRENAGRFIKNNKKEQTFSGDLYLMTSTKTYSSAMKFAMIVADNNLGTIVGEPSGNSPDGYGDILYFELKNSGLKAYIAYKKWYRIDESKSGEPVMPDYIVPAEEALDEVLAIIKQKH